MTRARLIGSAVVLGILLSGFTAVAIAGRRGPSYRSAKTQIVRWNPFDSAGKLKRSLKIENYHGECVDVGSPTIGYIGYRCNAGNSIANTCWRDGSEETDYVICVIGPWDKTTVGRIRAPHFLIKVGVTYGAALDYPWGIELLDGTRCGLAVGNRDSIHQRGKNFVVDYGCGNDLVLLRGISRGSGGLSRGPVWKIPAARYVGDHYVLLGSRRIRRVIFGSLPPPMARQNELARKARIAAARIIRHRLGFRGKLSLLYWVRLTLPDGEWARVKYESWLGPNDYTWFALLHRSGGSWVEVSGSGRSCQRLPADTRRQLGLRCR